MQLPVVSHTYRWLELSPAEFDTSLEQFCRLGVTQLSLSAPQGLQLALHPEIAEFISHRMESTPVAFRDLHAPCGMEWDLCCPFPELRVRMLRVQKNLFRCRSLLGAETVTMHIGNTDSGRPLAELRDWSCRSLEILLPEAEKNHLTLLLENTVFPTDTAEELLNYLRQFKSSALGLCFDTGHANIMSAESGKSSADLIEWIPRRWPDGVVRFSTNTLSLMLPYIVSCHLHDNNGRADQHKLPGDGTVNWSLFAERLQHEAPRLRTLQNEANWVGIHSPRAVVERFQQLFPVGCAEVGS